MIRIHLFGGLSVIRDDGQTITHFETRMNAALLAYLAYHRKHAHSCEMLSEMFWPDSESSNSSLRTARGTLNKTLGPALLKTGNTMALDSAMVTTDVAEFEAALQSAAVGGTPAQQLEHFSRAIELYEGELLPGYSDDWIDFERVRLTEAYVSALLHVASISSLMGNRPHAINFAQQAIRADPLREDAYRLLMRLFALSARMPDMIRVFRDMERVLRQELGVPPTAVSRELFTKLQNEATTPVSRALLAKPEDVAKTRTSTSGRWEVPGGAMPLDSPYYIVRPTDEQFVDAVVKGASIVLVRGPAEVGKSSLLARGARPSEKSRQSRNPYQFSVVEYGLFGFTRTITLSPGTKNTRRTRPGRFAEQCLAQ